MPLVHRSEASRWQASRADAAGPRHGIIESGSVVSVITRPAPSRITAQSPPTPGPTSTSARVAPRCGAIRRSKAAGESLPRAVAAMGGPQASLFAVHLGDDGGPGMHRYRLSFIDM